MKKGMWFYVTSDGFDVDFFRENSGEKKLSIQTGGLTFIPESPHPAFWLVQKLNDEILKDGEDVTPSKDGEGSSKS